MAVAGGASREGVTTARPIGVTAAMMVAGVAILALGSRAVVPIDPVPITGQTLAVTVIGALFGWRLGAATVVVWLALAAAGAPLLADGAAGVARFSGASGGYLIAFPFAAALVGWLREQGWTGFGRALAAMLAGNALCLALGAGWLAAFVGPAGAIAKGVLPFLPGAAVKSIVGALLVVLARRRAR